MKNRVCIYFFYDEDGIVDNYVFYFLNELKKVVSTTIVVANGYLTTESRNRLETNVDYLICRENVGFDSWAYKEAINAFGWEKLLNYDELLMVNFTMFGPFYPFEEVFDRMEASEADFWGLQRSYENRNLKTIKGKKTVHGYMPEFPLSSFWVIRKRLLHSYEFKHYWDTLHEINDYADACIYHEPVFAKSMCDYGYVMDALVSEKEKNYCANPTIDNVYDQLVNERVPIIRRRAFFNPFEPIHDEGFQASAAAALEYVKNNTDYDIGLIYENLLRTCNQYDLYHRMMHNYIVSDSVTRVLDNNEIPIGAGFYIDSITTAQTFFPFICQAGAYADVYIFADDTEACTYLKETSGSVQLPGKLTFIEPEASENSHQLYMMKYLSTLNRYKYIFLAQNPAGLPENIKEIISDTYIKRLFDAALKNKEVIQNIICLFEENKNLGILSPLPAYHSIFYKHLGNPWNNYFNEVKQLIDSNKIKTDLNISKSPIAPFAGVFWYRADALKNISEFEVNAGEYEHKDLDYIIDCCIPYYAQTKGFFSAYTINTAQANVDIMMKSFMLENLNQSILSNNGYTTLFRKTLRIISSKVPVADESPDNVVYVEKPVMEEVNPEEFIETVSTSLLLKKILKRMMPKKIWNILRRRRYEKTLLRTHKQDFMQ